MVETLDVLGRAPMFWILVAMVGLVLGGLATVAGDRLGRAAAVMDAVADALAQWQLVLWPHSRAARSDPPAPAAPGPATQAPAETIAAALASLSPDRSLWQPPSACDGCQRPLTTLQKLPVIGWIASRGRCRRCGYRVPLMLPLAEALTALIFGALAWRLGPEPALWPALLLVWFLVALALADLLHQTLPDALTFPMLWAGLGAAALGLWPVTPGNAILSAAGLYLLVRGLDAALTWVKGHGTIGGGDVMMMTALGAWYGYQMLMLLVLGAVLLGLLQAAGRALLGDPQWRENKFGHSLALSALLVLPELLEIAPWPGILPETLS